MQPSTRAPVRRPFRQVDVFTATPYFGNPVAVVLDGSGLDDDTMQQFARWTNLSETTFVLPPTQPEADYRLRIFTPGGELPFAGHPTLGTCHAWLQSGGQPRSAGEVLQECKVGVVRVQRQHTRLAFAAPQVKRGMPRPEELARIMAALGLQPGDILAAQLLDNGPVWLGLLLADPQTVLRLNPDHLELKNIGLKVGVAARYSAGGDGARATATSGEPDLEVRAFAAPIGVQEDPVTGSLNASLAQWLMAEGRMPREYLAAQGRCLGRAGRVHIHQDDAGQVWVGGDSVTCIDGHVEL